MQNNGVNGMTKKTAPQIIMVMNGPPWSEWTMSGVSKGVSEALLKRGVLYGAISHRCSIKLNSKRPDRFSQLREKLRAFIGLISEPEMSPWISEDDHSLAPLLNLAPDFTPVIYTYVNPIFSQNRKLRRFRWIGISILDAVKYESYGYEGISEKTLAKKYQEQYETIHQSEAIFTHSSYGAESISRDFDYPREKIFPIGAGASIVFRYPVKSDSTRYKRANILFVGRDWERKGGPLAYDAFLLLKEKIPHATFTIVGPTVQPVFGDGVIFEGFLRKHKFFERRKIKKLYLEASLFCTPSVCETWGLVYVEAAASGLPIIGTHEWAMPDIVINGKTGVLVKERTQEALCDAMYEVLCDPLSAQRMGSAAISHVDQVLDWPNVADRIIAAISPESLQNRQPRWLPQDLDRCMLSRSQSSLK
ncbi:MAG TPA: hypothetical protein DCE52_16290 [Rhodobacteraceae bacterium]|jgi:glycosyltransferase involved in cell wall biosynthesis|nr:hypothetical protein [Paracoccaceae bacterium]